MENREIDLLELVKKLKFFIRRNVWILIIMFILGGSLGYFLNINKKPTYSSTGVFSSWVEKDLLVKLLESFGAQIKTGNHEFLANVTGMPVDEINEITSFEFWLYEDDLRTRVDDNCFNYINKSTVVSIEVLAKTKKSLKNFSNYFFNYFNNNTLLQAELRRRIITLTDIKTEIDYEIINHRSRNQMMLNNNFPSNSFINYNYEMNDIIELVKIKKDIEYALKYPDIVNFSQDISIPFIKPGSVIRSVLLFGVFFFVIGFFISFLRK